MFDLEAIREQFPALHQKVYNKPLVYFDNAATTHKPLALIERISHYYRYENSNIHRGAHYLSQQATEAFEEARRFAASMINAAKAHEIIFTKGATEAINLAAHSFGRMRMKADNSILVTAMEHHSNLIPWQQLCLQHNGKLLVAPMDELGQINLEAYSQLLDKQPVIVAITHTSNVLGTINPVKTMIRMAHDRNIPVLVDGAQAIAHTEIDVQDLDCDFFAFSAHKAYGPMGAGLLYGKEKWLEAMPPYQFGGEMVDSVSFDKTTFNVLPFKFEAGTPNVEAVLGMETALRFIRNTGYQAIATHEKELLDYATAQLSKIPGIRFFGQAPEKASVISFLIGDIHPFDLGTLLDKMGIAVRTGHHCAQPVMDFFNIPGTVRASFAIYNTTHEIDTFVAAVKKAALMLS